MRVKLRARVTGVLLVVLMGLVTTGCDREPDTKAEPESTRLLRAAVVAFKDAKTVRASFTIDESGGSLSAREVSGDAEVVVGTGDMSVKYTDVPTITGAVKPPDVTGQLVVTGGIVYQRWTTAKTVDQAKWTRPDPAEKAPMDSTMRIGYLALVSTKLLDPLVLLDTGLDGVPGEVTRDGDETKVKYDWHFAIAEPRGRLKSWVGQTGQAPDLNITLTLDAQGRVTMASFQIFANAVYTGRIRYEEYGKPLTVTAPADAA